MDLKKFVKGPGSRVSDWLPLKRYQRGKIQNLNTHKQGRHNYEVHT